MVIWLLDLETTGDFCNKLGLENMNIDLLLLQGVKLIVINEPGSDREEFHMIG